MAARIRAHPWSATPLGPIAGWPHALRLAVEIALAAPQPVCLSWGPDGIQLYNDAYARLLPPGEAQARLGSPAAATPAAGPVRAEGARQQSELRQAFLLGLSDALRRIKDPGEVLAKACRVVGEYLGANRVGYAEDAGDGVTVAVTCNFADRVRGIEGVYRYDDYGPALLEALRAGRTMVRPHIAGDPLLTRDEKEAHAVLQIGASVNVPLVKGGRLTAVLFLHFHDAHAFLPEEVALVEDVAERTWEAVERARAEEALRQSEDGLRRLNEELEQRVADRTRQITALFQRLVSVQEDERRRIARDIHDQLGQQMTALRLNIEALSARAARDRDVIGQVRRTQRLAEELDQSIDFLTWELRPAALDHLGLPAALHHLAAGWSERFGVGAAVDVTGDAARLPADVEANLYRIAQEALHNVVKHAEASHVLVRLDRTDLATVLTIADDGRGFDPAEASGPEEGRGLGLIGMRERATLAGGRLEIASAPGAGTSIVVRVPAARGRSTTKR
jgi:signal transduction histidine kinase